MTTILCYGDSNTYGYNPVNGLRYPKAVMEEQQFLKILLNHGKQDLAI